MLEVVVPLVHPASPPLKPPRVDWHDPFILLHLLADAHARERAESDPFAPGSAETARFDTIPPRPFLETAGHAAIAQVRLCDTHGTTAFSDPWLTPRSHAEPSRVRMGRA